MSLKARYLFEEWGRRGGQARARRLSSSQRLRIAMKAAHSRWGRPLAVPPLLPSVRLEGPQLTDPVYLEEILEEGTWEDWRVLYQRVADQPFGEIAVALERVCASRRIYGITALWKGLLRCVQGGYT